MVFADRIIEAVMFQAMCSANNGRILTLVDALLSVGADVNRDLATPFKIAVAYVNIALLEGFLERDYDLSTYRWFHEIPASNFFCGVLDWHVRYRNRLLKERGNRDSLKHEIFRMVKILSSTGGNVNEVTVCSDGYILTPLLLAADLGLDDFVEAFLQVGADPTYCDRKRLSPLDRARSGRKTVGDRQRCIQLLELALLEGEASCAVGGDDLDLLL